MTTLDVGVADYDVIGEISRGGSSIIYEARQRSFDRPVAIKVLSSPDGAKGQAQFQRECLAIGRLSGHPGIVTVYEAGTAADGGCWLVMELLPGDSLAGVLDTGCLPPNDVARIGVVLAGALESAHRAGIIHGDVKPENVLLSRFGEPKLADFGLARLQGERVSRAGLIGTLPYMAPEVLAGAVPTAAGDIYSLAVTLYTLLAGQPPFAPPSESDVATLAARIAAEAPASLRPQGVPDLLCRIIEQGLARTPGDRQESMAQLGRQLQAFQTQAGAAITPLLVDGDDPELEVDRPTRRRRGSRLSRLAGVGLLVAGLFGLAFPPKAESIRLSPLFRDDFETAAGWYEHDDPIVGAAYDAGRYRLTVKQPGQQVLSDTAFRGPIFGQPMTALGDVSLRVTSWSDSGTGLFGLVCRQSEARTAFYEGLVGVDGTARILKHLDGQLTTLATSPIALPAPAAPIRLRLDCAGDAKGTRLRLFIDGRSVVDTVDRHALPPGSVGMAAATAEADSVTAVFDDFVVLGRRTDVR